MKNGPWSAVPQIRVRKPDNFPIWTNTLRGGVVREKGATAPAPGWFAIGAEHENWLSNWQFAMRRPDEHLAI